LEKDFYDWSTASGLSKIIFGLAKASSLYGTLK
jgi:hypothetical protein